MESHKIFDRLQSILKRYEEHLLVIKDLSDNYYLDTPITDQYKKSDFFGAVQIKKSYITFHLMPTYYYPDLLINISPALKKNMQGKTCFNFKNINESLFAELIELTDQAFTLYKEQGRV